MLNGKSQDLDRAARMARALAANGEADDEGGYLARMIAAEGTGEQNAVAAAAQREIQCLWAVIHLLEAAQEMGYRVTASFKERLQLARAKMRGAAPQVGYVMRMLQVSQERSHMEIVRSAQREISDLQSMLSVLEVEAAGHDF